MLQVEKLFEKEHMDLVTAFDGNMVSPAFQFANIVYGKPKNDPYGHKAVNGILENPKHKSMFEKYGIYEIQTQRKAIVYALTYPGLKELLNYLKGPLADDYRAYCNDITTRYEAGDDDHIKNAIANKASSNIINQMARDAVAQQKASAGQSIAPPPEQVLAALIVCFGCT